MGIKKICVTILFALIAFTACGSNANEEEYDNVQTELTLNVQIPHAYYRIFRQAERDMSSALEPYGVDFNLEINYYTFDDDFVEVHMRLQTMLMAGQGFDIFLWDSHPIRRFANAGLLTDIYDLIDNHPTTSRDDFNTNILQAFEMSNGLYSFPLSFGFEYIGINRSLPQSIYERFTAHDVITISEIMSLYFYLQEYYADDFSHFGMINRGYAMTLLEILPIVMADFIDFDSRTSNLDHPSFISALDDMGRLFIGTDISMIHHRADPLPTSEYFDWAFYEYAFVNLSRRFSPLVMMFDMLDVGFSHFIPIANSDGNLLIDPHPWSGRTPVWAKLCIPRAGNGDLAWEFILHLNQSVTNLTNINDSAQINIMTSLATPITNAHFRHHITTVIERISQPPYQELLSPFPVFNNGGLRENDIENALNALDTLNNMPAQVIEAELLWLLDDNPNVFMDFFMGVTTAQETARDLHNMVSLWLIE